MIKVISFDIGGTLLNNSKSDKVNLRNLAKLINIDYDKTRKAYKEVFQKKNDTFDELTDEFVRMLKIEKTDKLIAFLKKKFSCQMEEISNENIEMIKSLKKEGYRIILFSNSCNLINNLDSKYDKYFDEKFYSYEIGYTKNENESYRIVEEKLKVKANEILHIGDNLESDYLMPTKNGWNALYFGNKVVEKDVKKIKKLSDILEYLNEGHKKGGNIHG